ncbi:hypothetical protein PspLS_11892 [Pyricularia sp. CBS 133598]|nr:hypothetical protein PspLS_11892 [Pyricularia sp. CBS 133598]
MPSNNLSCLNHKLSRNAPRHIRLLKLANDVPERCIVLLEDTDTIGLKRGEFKGPRLYPTTKPESLDEALIRPGPADLTLLRQHNQKITPEICFGAWYTPDTSPKANDQVKLVAEFGSKISDEVFSPAELQNYLALVSSADMKFNLPHGIKHPQSKITAPPATIINTAHEYLSDTLGHLPPQLRSQLLADY